MKNKIFIKSIIIKLQKHNSPSMTSNSFEETILFYGGYPTSSRQFNYLSLVFYRYYLNPFNCSHKNLPQLEIIYDCLKKFNEYNKYDHMLNKCIGYQIYLIAKEMSYFIELTCHATIENVFGPNFNGSNSEQDAMIDFVNKMTHLITYHEYNRNKLIILLESLISQIKQSILYHKHSLRYGEEEMQRICNKLFRNKN